MVTLLINTTDKDFLQSLKDKNIEGVQLAVRRFAMDSFDAPTFADMGTIVVSITGTIALNIVSNWIYDRIKNGSQHTITINQQNITNIEQLNIVINNTQIEQNKGDKG